MSFLSPAWLTTGLLGLAALSIPIIIHYLFRSRYRVVNWAAMQFLKKSLEETTRRIQFRELLLLLLRIALLALFAFALMRPSSKQKQGDANSPVDAVLIMDTSGSMAIAEKGGTRLEQARQAALRILDALPSQSTVHILQTGQHVIDLGPASPTNRDQARFVIQRIEQSHEAIHLLPALQQAAEVLGRGALANKEVYLFSDMQRSDWNLDSADLQNAWATLQQLGEVILVQTEHDAQPTNAALVNLRPQVALPLPGDRVPFLVEVRNTCATTLSGLTVSLRSSDGERDSDTQAVPPLKPGETASLTLTTRLEKRGRNVVTAELQGDQLTIDNRLDAIIETRDRLNILIVDGQPNDADPALAASFFLAHALRSSRGQSQQEASQAVELNIVSANEAYPAQLADVQACFLVGLGTGPTSKLSAEFVDRLVSFTQNGGGLVLFAGGSLAEMGLDRIAVSPGNSKGLALLPAQWGDRITASATSPLTFDINSIPTGSFLSIFRHAPLDRLGQTETTQARMLAQIPSDALVALRFSDNQPALVFRTEGTGCIIMLAQHGDMLGTDLPLRPGYLPLIQAIIGQVLAQQAGKKNLIAGDSYSWSPPVELAQQRFSLLAPGSPAPQSLGTPAMYQQRLRLTTSATSKAGLYRIVPEGTQAEETGQDTSQVDFFAVAPDPAETASLTTLTADELNERFSQKPVHLSTDSLVTGGLDRSRVQHEWTNNLWWLILFVCLGELVFGWYCNREV